MVPLLQRVTLEERQSNQNALPHHSVPRLGSACPHSGIDPWAAATGHPWPGAANPASLPGYPRLNACVQPSWLTGRSDQKQKQDGGLPAGLAGNAVSVAAAERSEAAIEAEGLARRTPRFPRSCETSGLAALRADRSLAALGSGYTKRVRQKSCSVAKAASFGLALFWLWLLILLLIYPPLSQRPNAGLAQGAPRQGCRGSRTGPGMAHCGGPRSRTGVRACRALARHRMVGRDFLVTFGAFAKSDSP